MRRRYSNRHEPNRRPLSSPYGRNRLTSDPQLRPSQRGPPGPRRFCTGAGDSRRMPTSNRSEQDSAIALQAGYNAAQAEEWSRELEGLLAAEIVRWAVDRFGDGLVIGSSFGKDSLVIMDLARAALAGHPGPVPRDRLSFRGDAPVPRPASLRIEGEHRGCPPRPFRPRAGRRVRGGAVRPGSGHVLRDAEGGPPSPGPGGSARLDDRWYGAVSTRSARARRSSSGRSSRGMGTAFSR